jgi:hypothetical protein
MRTHPYVIDDGPGPAATIALATIAAPLAVIAAALALIMIGARRLGSLGRPR